jgi:hypothetical protein
MTQSSGAMLDANSDVNTNTVPTDKTLLCAPWIVFASGHSLREEYGTTTSTGIDATLEEEVSALCREFHNALGVQQSPDGLLVALFWKARQSSYHIITQVLRAPQQPGQRIAYEYFSLALTEDDLHKVDGNPLRALELIGVEQLREQWAAGLSEPVCATIETSRAASMQAAPIQSSHFSQNGIWPATKENRETLLAYVNSGEATGRTFVTWWPGAKPPTAGLFDIVLRCEATRVARPHEILALATELNHSLSRNLLAPPSYDNEGARCYRALLHSADEVETMLKEAYFPIALEESPHRWMTRPQKVAGLCQKIADDLPDYAARLPASFSAEIAGHCTELASRYGALGRDLQKLRHPNMLHQSQKPAPTAATNTAAYELDGVQGKKSKGVQFALVLAGLLTLCLVGFSVRKLVGESGVGQSNAGTSKTHLKGNALPANEAQRDQQALALMRTRATKEVFRIAHSLAVQRANRGKKLSKEAMQSTVVDAIAQAMLQTPHSQIKPAQKQLLFRMATAPIRAKALQGVKAGMAGIPQHSRIRRARH